MPLDLTIYFLNNKGDFDICAALKKSFLLRANIKHRAFEADFDGVEVHRPLIEDASNVFPMFVIDDLKNGGQTCVCSTTYSSTTY